MNPAEIYNSFTVIRRVSLLKHLALWHCSRLGRPDRLPAQVSQPRTRPWPQIALSGLVALCLGQLRCGRT